MLSCRNCSPVSCCVCVRGGHGIRAITQEKREDSDGSERLGRLCACSCKKGQNLSYKKGLCSCALLYPHVSFIVCIYLVSFDKRMTKSDVIDKVLHADLWILSYPSDPLTCSVSHAGNIAPLSYPLSALSGIPNTLGWRPLPALCVQQLCFVHCGPSQHGDLGGTVNQKLIMSPLTKAWRKWQWI